MAVDKHNFDRLPIERPGAGQPAKAGADDQDPGTPVVAQVSHA
jgi:hypothetical protein